MIVKDNELKKGELPINKIVLGDCLSVMRKFPSNSISTIICDPPYGLKFMGKKWDYDVPSIEVWKECLRVLKPGGTALIFAGSRTQHRMAVNVEDAGFILKDTLMWLHGQGFPKSTDISKQIDKKFGAERKTIKGGMATKGGITYAKQGGWKAGIEIENTAATPEAKLWKNIHL